MVNSTNKATLDLAVPSCSLLIVDLQDFAWFVCWQSWAIGISKANTFITWLSDIWEKRQIRKINLHHLEKRLIKDDNRLESCCS